MFKIDFIHFYHYFYVLILFLNKMSKNYSSEVYDLVKSMTQSEKRYFKQYIKNGNKEETSSCIQLFDAINFSKSYDEDALRMSESYIKNFSQQKLHLYALILRSLKEFHRSASSDIQIKELFIYADILKNKRLYNQSLKVLTKAESLASITENYYSLIESLYKQDEIHIDMKSHKSLERYEEIYQKEKSATEILENMMEYKNTLKQMYLHHYKYFNHADSEKVRSILNVDKRLSYYNANTLQLKIYYNNYKTLQFVTGNDFKKAYHSILKNVLLIESNLKFINDKPYEYIKILSSKLVIEDNLQYDDEALLTIKKMRSLLVNPGMSKRMRAFEAHIFVYTYTTELNILSHRCDFAQTENLILFIQGQIVRLGNLISEKEKKVFYYNFATIYFYLSKDKLAYKWLLKTIETQRGYSYDLTFFARLMKLLILFERNDMEYLWKISKKELNELSDCSVYEELFLLLKRFFTNLKSDPGKTTILHELTVLKKGILQSLKSPKNKNMLSDFDLLCWIEGQLTNKKMSTLLRENYKRSIK